MAQEFERECFFIAPIGDEDSEIRKRSNGVRDWLVRPAAEAADDLETIRADDVGEPGQITVQAVQHCLKAKAAVADLTGGNPNVYYELSVRHGAQLPVVLIAEEGTKLPFDISQSRVIFFDHTDLNSAGKAREELEVQIRASLQSPPDNPISDGMRLAQLQAGDVEEQTLAVVLDRLQRLAVLTEQIDERLSRAESLAIRRQAPLYLHPPEERDEFGSRLVSWDEYRKRVNEEGPSSNLAADLKAEIEAEQRQERPPGPGDLKG
ncbi:MAG TPA: hypothetical protein VJU14_10680 [Solirubrobacterales bacterium]|nr:hypothetical protein [Solirubrobacterales bacterium]